MLASSEFLVYFLDEQGCLRLLSSQTALHTLAPRADAPAELRVSKFRPALSRIAICVYGSVTRSSIAAVWCAKRAGCDVLA